MIRSLIVLLLLTPFSLTGCATDSEPLAQVPEAAAEFGIEVPGARPVAAVVEDSNQLVVRIIEALEAIKNTQSVTEGMRLLEPLVAEVNLLDREIKALSAEDRAAFDEANNSLQAGLADRWDAAFEGLVSVEGAEAAVREVMSRMPR